MGGSRLGKVARACRLLKKMRESQANLMFKVYARLCSGPRAERVFSAGIRLLVADRIFLLACHRTAPMGRSDHVFPIASAQLGRIGGLTSRRGFVPRNIRRFVLSDDGCLFMNPGRIFHARSTAGVRARDASVPRSVRESESNHGLL